MMNHNMRLQEIEQLEEDHSIQEEKNKIQEEIYSRIKNEFNE